MSDMSAEQVFKVLKIKIIPWGSLKVDYSINDYWKPILNCMYRKTSKRRVIFTLLFHKHLDFFSLF